MVPETFHQEQLCRNHTHFGRDCGRIRSTLSLPRSASILKALPYMPFLDTLQMFTKYNKHYQNLNSKRLQLTTVYLLTD
jgi:hypothetical protein